MANPNIVSVATILGGNAGWNLSASTTATLLTVTAEYILKINRIVVANVDGTNGAEVDVAITWSAGTQTGVTVNTTAATTAYLAKTIEVPADSSLVILDTPIYLRETDILKAKAEAVSDLDLFISYELLID